jgi:hypothetical protein
MMSPAVPEQPAARLIRQNERRPNPEDPAGRKFVGYFLTSGQSLSLSGRAASSAGIVAISL